MKRLVLMRHAKSDWSRPVSDRLRPITDRGVRQASQAGQWLMRQDWRIDLAVVSPATRASGAWDLASAELGYDVPARRVEQVYTFDGDDLVEVVHRLPAQVQTVALVGHNPAMESAVHSLTGEWVEMKTSAIAVVELPHWGSGVGALVVHGRPPLGAST